jgi:hypothetical protein
VPSLDAKMLRPRVLDLLWFLDCPFPFISFTSLFAEAISVILRSHGSPLSEHSYEHLNKRIQSFYLPTLSLAQAATPILLMNYLS